MSNSTRMFVIVAICGFTFALSEERSKAILPPCQNVPCVDMTAWTGSGNTFAVFTVGGTAELYAIPNVFTTASLGNIPLKPNATTVKWKCSSTNYCTPQAGQAGIFQVTSSGPFSNKMTIDKNNCTYP